MLGLTNAGVVPDRRLEEKSAGAVQSSSFPAEGPGPSLWRLFPEEMWAAIFSKLNYPEQLAKLAATCKIFKMASDDNRVWKALAGKVFSVDKFPSATNFKELYCKYKLLWPTQSAIYLFEMFHLMRRELVEAGHVVDRRLPYAGEPEFEMSRFLLIELQSFAKRAQFPVIDHKGRIERFFVANDFPLPFMSSSSYSPEILWIAEAIIQAPFSFPWLIKEQNDVSHKLKKAAQKLKDDLEQLRASILTTPGMAEPVKGKESVTSPEKFLKILEPKWLEFDRSWGHFLDALVEEQQDKEDRSTLLIGKNGAHHFPEGSLASYYKTAASVQGKQHFASKFEDMMKDFMNPECHIALPEIMRSVSNPTTAAEERDKLAQAIKDKIRALF